MPILTAAAKTVNAAPAGELGVPEPAPAAATGGGETLEGMDGEAGAAPGNRAARERVYWRNGLLMFLWFADRAAVTRC